MTTPAAFDRTLRVVMWCDATLSVAAVPVGLVGAPLAALARPGSQAREVVALATLAAAVVLAACGAITAVVLMVRLNRGNGALPPRLWLPLPDPLRPADYRRHRAVEAESAAI